MKKRKFLLYPLLAIIAIVLAIYTYKGPSFTAIQESIKKCRIRWIILATLCHLVNHAFRSYRWKLFINQQGYNATLKSTFLCEMNGFFVNTFLGRIGELVRSRNLQKIEGTPYSLSLSSIVLEKSMDIVFFTFLFLGFSAFNVEVFPFLKNLLPFGNYINPQNYLKIGILLVVIALSTLALSKSPFWQSFKAGFASFIETFKVLVRDVVKRKGLVLWSATFFITFFQFLVEYVSLFAFEETSNLPISKAIFIFFMANLSLALPIPGGAGVYEIIMHKVLIFCGVSTDIAIAYTLITHAIQYFNAIVVGGLSTLMAFFFPHKKNP